MIERPLSNTERAIWRQGRISLNMVQPVVLERRIPLETLQQAITRVRPRYPQLAMRVRKGEAGRVFLTSEGVTAPTVRVVTGTGGWTREALSELAFEFDWARGPLARFTLLQADGRSTLLVNLHHLLGDGRSIAHLIADLLAAVRDPDLRFPRRALPATLDELCPADAIPNIGRVGLRFARLLSSLVLRSDRHGRPVAKKPNLLLAWRLDEHASRRLMARCHEAGFSVHAALCTAFQLASRSIQGDRPRLSGVYTPVDVRKRLHAPVGDAFGLYASESVIRVRPTSSRRFASEASRIAARVKRGTEDARVLRLIALAGQMHPRLVDRLISHVLDRQGLWEGLAISNLGRVDLPASTLPLVREYCAPASYVRRAEKSLSVITASGRMAFTFLCRTSALDEAALERIRDHAMEILRGPW